MTFRRFLGGLAVFGYASRPWGISQSVATARRETVLSVSAACRAEDTERCHGISVDMGKRTASDDRLVKVWDWRTGRERFSLVGHRVRVYTLGFSPDGRTLASGGRDEELKLWHVPTGKRPLLGDPKCQPWGRVPREGGNVDLFGVLSWADRAAN